jgi:carboxypeptidase family protein
MVSIAPGSASGAQGTQSPPAPSGQVSGAVYSPSRAPVRGASVALVPETGEEMYGTSTGEDGIYGLKDLKPATYSVLVKDSGGSLLRKDHVHARPLFRNIVDFITETSGAQQPHLPALPAAPEGGTPPMFDLSGLLTGTDGSSIPEVWVTLSPMGGESPELRARSDAEGRFKLLRIPTGYYRITARSLGHVTWSLGPLLFGEAGERSLRLTLLPFPLGHPQNPEDLIVPVEPVPPENFEKEP